MRKVLALTACLAILILVNFSIANKERHLANGLVAYLELAPVDPRSLMQGDYMALRFKMANDARPNLKPADDAPSTSPRRELGLAPADGRLVATLDANLIATYSRVDDGTPLAPNEILLRYRVRGGEIKFATNAFFFQEGSATRYEGARYGEFRVASNGDLLLTGLRGKDLQLL